MSSHQVFHTWFDSLVAYVSPPVRNPNTSSVLAIWIGTLVAAAGLGGLIAQTPAIRDLSGPFFLARSNTGKYSSLLPTKRWWSWSSAPSVGPHFAASRTEGFCGLNEVWLSRKPTEATGKASWNVMLAVFHASPAQDAEAAVDADAEESDRRSNDTEFNTQQSPQYVPSHGWLSLPAESTREVGDAACTTISRATYMTMLALSNARVTLLHSGAAGYRAGFGSYAGQWNIEWPISSPAVLTLTAHDSHLSGSDVYPRFFKRRVDKCLDMLAGIMDADGFKVAFPGRKDPGNYKLTFQKGGFGGAHGSRHLYNMMGGKAHEVDFLHRSAASAQEIEGFGANPMRLSVPSLSKGEMANVYLTSVEEEVILQALDRLPWSPLSWSMHRGMKDMLVAYGQPVLDEVRSQLADRLRQAVLDQPDELIAKGWNSGFVRNNMPEMVHSTVMSRVGDSGDLVRVLADSALLLHTGREKDLDRTKFWERRDRRRPGQIDGNGATSTLDEDAIIALTKLIVLEWSQELDYQMYHELPMEILVA